MLCGNERCELIFIVSKTVLHINSVIYDQDYCYYDENTNKQHTIQKFLFSELFYCRFCAILSAKNACFGMKRM